MRIPETVNLHIWPKCNLSCVYCYGTFPARPATLSGAEWCSIIRLIGHAGVRRITFSGGEPTLHPDLLEMLDHARRVGLQTSIISNGARLTDEVLERLDLVGLTIDSCDDALQARLGRGLPQGRSYRTQVEDIARRARDRGVRLKLNTVVTALNVDENLAPLVSALRPAKWKPMQFVYVPGENDLNARDLCVSASAFDSFVDRHRDLVTVGIVVVPETADTIRSTYVVVDPAGRVFQHGTDGHRLSPPLLEIGIGAALEAVGGYDRAAFENRGGHVDVRRLPLLRGGDR